MEVIAENLKKVKIPKKITKIRLQNIALYYLRRFDTSVQKLREVLQKRINDYAKFDKNFNRREAYSWVEELLDKFVSARYLDDERFAENKIRNYINAGKSRRYIENKLKEKGINKDIVDACFDEAEYNPWDVILNFARKKKIACFRMNEDVKKEMRQKDMGVLVRAGFDYDLVLRVLDYQIEEI